MDPGAAASRACCGWGSVRSPPGSRWSWGSSTARPTRFYRPGATWDESAAMDRVGQVIAEGADIVDIGGVPAAPGSEVNAGEEIRRVAGFVAAVRGRYPDVVISADTFRHEVGREACAAGADLINDSWGGWDGQLAGVARRVRGRPGLRARRPPPAADPAVPGRLRRRHGGRAGSHAPAGPPGRAGRRGPGPDHHRRRARLRQEHLALAGDHPAAERDDRDRVAGPGVACPTRTSSARPSAPRWRSA